MTEYNPGTQPDKPARKPNALTQHSVRDDYEERAARDVEPVPVLAQLACLGQLFMLYAAPGAGKTLLILRLILDAVGCGRVDPENIVYVNADDSRIGADRKAEILAKIGAHTLVPNDKGFKLAEFTQKLRQVINEGAADGMVVIIDTLKKFTNVMEKSVISEFNKVCREFALAGGTLIALGHVTKYNKPDGTPKYQGTTDTLEDFDAVYVGQPMDGAPGSNERVILLTREKSRGDSPQKAAYAFSTQEGLTYEEKLDSIRELCPDEAEGRLQEANMVEDAEVISALEAYLASGHGHVGMDQMTKVIARAENFRREHVRRVLDRYTGTDPEKHKWHFTPGASGKRTYYLLTFGPDSHPPAP